MPSEGSEPAFHTPSGGRSPARVTSQASPGIDVGLEHSHTHSRGHWLALVPVTLQVRADMCSRPCGLHSQCLRADPSQRRVPALPGGPGVVAKSGLWSLRRSQQPSQSRM